MIYDLINKIILLRFSLQRQQEKKGKKNILAPAKSCLFIGKHKGKVETENLFHHFDSGEASERTKQFLAVLRFFCLIIPSISRSTVFPRKKSHSAT